MQANAGIPVIETWDLPENPIGHVIGFSNTDVVRGMENHFVVPSLACIASIGSDETRDTGGANRRAGFIAAIRRLPETLPYTQAVICLSDPAAFGAMTECQRRGVAVPGRLWIAGFGDYEIAGIAVPALTTINPFPNEIGAHSFTDP